MDAKTMIAALKRLYPEFYNSRFEVNQQGWANLVLVADKRWIFRVARNLEAEKRLEYEKAILPKLKERVELKVPDFQYAGIVEGRAYVGYRLIPGLFFSKEQLNACAEETRLRAAKDIAAFLSGLHALNPAEAGLEGFDEMIPDPWQALEIECMKQMPLWLSKEEMDWIRKLFADFDKMRKMRKGPNVLIHADFTDDHILFDIAEKRIAGIIDFGDLRMGDPALDFAGIALTYGDEFLSEVISFYTGEVDGGIWDRIHCFYAQQVPLHGLLYGIETKNQHLIDDAIRQIRIRKNER